MGISEVQDNTFDQEVLQSNLPVLVDFWAAWCGPCRALAPKIEEISKTYDGKVRFVKLDVEGNPSVPAKYGIRGIPTLILFKGGKMVDQIVGNQPKDVIEQLLAKVL